MAILSQALHNSCKEGAETSWFVSLVTCKTTSTPGILIGKAKDGDIVLASKKLEDIRESRGSMGSNPAGPTIHV